MFCVGLILLDAADPVAQPGHGRTQILIKHVKLRGIAAVRARSRQARCQGRAGAANHRRSGAPSARREESQSLDQDADYKSDAPGAPDRTRRSTELRVSIIL